MRTFDSFALEGALQIGNEKSSQIPLSLPPSPRKIEPREQCEVISMPRVGGLPHLYLRAA